jgi:hypothetical protein
LDDWNGSLQSVEVAENAVRQDSYVYTAQQISLRLEQLLDVAKNQESRLLQDIYCLLQQQVSVQMEKEDKECIQHLRLSDPRNDKKRIGISKQKSPILGLVKVGTSLRAMTWEEYRGGKHFASAYFPRMQFFQRVTLPQKLNPKHLATRHPCNESSPQPYPTYTHLIPNK